MNPIREFRKSQHKTLQEFADESGVHLQAVFLNEQGVYPNILPTLEQHMKNAGVDIVKAGEAYHDYVYEKRVSFGGALDLGVAELGPPDGDTHPVVAFREQYGLSRMALAKGICVHPASLQRLEQGKAFQLPEQFVEALTVAGMPANVIEELNFRCKEWAEGGWNVPQAKRVAS